jgi:hypothetical protein
MLQGENPCARGYCFPFFPRLPLTFNCYILIVRRLQQIRKVTMVFLVRGVVFVSRRLD